MHQINIAIRNWLALLAGLMSVTVVWAGDVDVSFSSREAYVGMPIVMQIEISNANDYAPPELPEIDGCDIASAGVPSRSSHLTIINGRRSEKQSVTLRYTLTPRRAGTFELPALSLQVDGQTIRTQPVKFLATKSETGDLLFVQLEGKAERVYVGQPLDMTLKIYLKPYRDRKFGLTLAEAEMWRLVSQQSTWGGFTKAMKEMSDRNQRPGGREVLRADAAGEQRSYYLYEIDAKIYPTRAGKIEADDVRIVVDYPTALGKTRDPFESFFNSSPFGNSPLSDLMDDSLFASPFDNRLAITATRPIAGDVEVDATQVLPVPNEGRPADYRGAVGKYDIAVEASPLNVKAGDAIRLNIGIFGTGPMDLVQAPPLSDQPELKDFKISNEPLAGFVRDETKVFSTSIRPRRAGITEIPPISFSFFNPDTASFETVTSEPIAITVGEADSLALDSIVVNPRKQVNSAEPSVTRPSGVQPHFENYDSLDERDAEQEARQAGLWWGAAGLPFCVWLAALIWTRRSILARHLPSVRTPRARCFTRLDRAATTEEILAAMDAYFARAIRLSENQETASTPGALRLAGHYPLAAEYERLEAQCTRHSEPSQAVIAQLGQSARQLVESFEAARRTGGGPRIKRPEDSRTSVARLGRMFARRTTIVLACLLSDSAAAQAEPPAAAAQAEISLSAAQQATVFAEANELYRSASKLVETDPLEAEDRFARAAEKYSLLVQSGVASSRLFFNLGNAYYRAGQLGLAIVNYQRAHQRAPSDRQTAVNLQLARSMVVDAPDTPAGQWTRLQNWNALLLERTGLTWMRINLVVAAICFWGMLTVKLLRPRLCVWPWASVSLAAMLFASASLLLPFATETPAGRAILIADEVVLRAGDGEQFEEIATIQAAQGQPVELLNQRGNWSQIRTATDRIGWLTSESVEAIAL